MMVKRGMIRSLVALVVLLAVVAAVAQWDTAKATYEPTMAVSISDTEAGDNADVTTTVTIPTGDYNFDVMIVFTPPEFGLGAEDTPLGAYVADLKSEATLGLLNNVCITALPVSFMMVKATTDKTAMISFDDGFADLDGNTVPDAVDKYPDFLETMYPGITPVARSYGQTSVAGTPVSMNQVVFAPGTTLHGQAFDASLGYGVVSVLNDPTAELEPGSITDFCTPLLSDTTSFGMTKDNPETAADESGYVGRTNPTAGGTYTFTTFTVSQGDADGDGAENDIDTCPFDVNQGDPRVAGDGDPDNDGLDSACDPEPEVANTDVDDDVYLNRGDNCPLVNNPDNADSDGDRIGDACDPNPNTVDGVGTAVTLTESVTITGGVAAETPTEEPAETPTEEPAETPTEEPAETPTVQPTVQPTPSPTPTPTPTPTPIPTPTPPVVGGAGLLGSDDGGFPVWAIYVIGVAAALMLGGIGTAATVVRRRKQ